MICNRKHLKIFFLVVSAMMGLSILLFLAVGIEDDLHRPFRRWVVMTNQEHLRQDVILDIIRYFNPNLSNEQRELICETIMGQAIKTDLEPFWVASVIAAESSFRPKALSRCAARGLMQITDTVSIMMGIDNPYDIYQNIAAGTQYLKGLRQRFESDDLVLAAYNAGPTRVARLGRVPRIRETVDYIKKVTRSQISLQQDLQARIHRLIVRVSLENPLTLPQVAVATGSITDNLYSLEEGLIEGLRDSCEPSRRLFILQA